MAGGKQVVVIGGGVAGSLAAKSLQFHGDVTLIDPKEYFEIPWASLRSMVEPAFAERSVINHRDYVTNGRVISSPAVDITDTEVLTAEGRRVLYDYLVIATGHDDPYPKSRTERLQHYKEETEKIDSARSILIVGGGPTGVELAGEIVVDYPGREITLIHDGPRLLEFLGPKASNKAYEWLTSKRVNVKLNQTVDLDSSSGRSRTFKTSNGENVRADCLFVCTGRPVGSEWLRETVLGDKLDAHGRLIVDEYLRVKGHSNIFAIGDITNVPEKKQGYAAQKHALVAAENLKKLLMMKGGGGGKEAKLVMYKKPQSVEAIVSLGRNDAVAQYRLTTILGLVPGLIKSRDLFVGKTRKQLGLKTHLLYE